MFYKFFYYAFYSIFSIFDFQKINQRKFSVINKDLKMSKEHIFFCVFYSNTLFQVKLNSSISIFVLSTLISYHHLKEELFFVNKIEMNDGNKVKIKSW